MALEALLSWMGEDMRYYEWEPTMELAGPITKRKCLQHVT